MKKSKDTILFICKKDFLWNWDGFQILQHHFETVHLVTWDGNEEELPKIHEIIKELTYDYLISFWNVYYILPHEFGAAKKGAINVHPAPLEHPGVGMFSYIFAFPDKRLHHGTTVHEVNEKFDNGQIYISTKFPCYGMSPEEIARCSVMDSLNILEKIAQKLKMGGNTTILGDDDSNTPEWGAHFFTHRQEIEWLKQLPVYHVAHRAETFTVTMAVSSNYFAHNSNSFDNYFRELRQI